MATAVSIVKLVAAHYDAAATVLARAFHDDPLWLYVLPGPGARARVLPAVFRWFVEYSELAGECLTLAGVPRAAALWLREGEANQNSNELVARIKVPTPGDALGSEAARRFWTCAEQLGQLHQREIPGPHWYLPWLGVDPELQGTGAGGALLRTMLERAERQNLPCYLETYQPRNVDFYRKRGFRVVVEAIQPSSNLPFWTFRRDPP